MSPYNPDWDRDLAFGEAQEVEVEGILSAIRNGGLTYEVKSDRYCNGHWYLEWEQRPVGRDYWKPSGIQTTKADLWVVRFPEPVDALEVWRTSRLRLVAESGRLGRLRDGGKFGDNPTRGWVVTGPQITNYLRVLDRQVAAV